MHQLVKKLDRYVHQNWPLSLILGVLFLLRFPNFFEPYWYGDEGIYLTLGIAMRQGERLYLEIIDHKTPIIYYLAMVPTQFWFRVLLLCWMIASTILFYELARKILRDRLSVILSTAFFMLVTTLPAFEGNIPNGELFVMGFILFGAWLFSFTSLFRSFFEKKIVATKNMFEEKALLFFAGVFFSLGVLTKVPAVFDAAAFLAVGWFLLLDYLPLGKLYRRDSIWQNARQVMVHLLIMGAGILVPIFLSALYYILRGSGQAYLDYGLLYNFRYAESWHLGFQSQLLLFAFSLKGKIILLALFMVLLSAGRNFFSPAFKFILSWFGLALVASLLSNRPYPHYYLQVFPPLSLCVGYLIFLFRKRFSLSFTFLAELIFSVGSLGLFVIVLKLLSVGFYPTASYYARFGQFATHQMTWQVYRDSFDHLMADNYAAAKMIKSSPEPKIFIWGTDPMLYALTQKAPVGRFTVSFHIKDFHAETETFQVVSKAKPEFIVVMNGESELPGLNDWLQSNYMPNNSFQNFVVWRRIERPTWKIAFPKESGQ